MRVQRIIAHKGQLDGPVVGQVQRAPLGVVKPGLGEGEIAGLGKVSLAHTEAQIAGRVGAVAELKLPAKVEEQPLARRHSGLRLAGCSAGYHRGAASPCRAATREETERASPDESSSRREIPAMKNLFPVKRQIRRPENAGRQAKINSKPSGADRYTFHHN